MTVGRSKGGMKKTSWGGMKDCSRHP
jgi:hypothetical protein